MKKTYYEQKYREALDHANAAVAGIGSLCVPIQRHTLFHFWRIDLKRNRTLEVSTSAFDMMVTLNSKNSDGVSDVIVLFNRDYDGILTKERVEEIYHAITNNHLTTDVLDTSCG